MRKLPFLVSQLMLGILLNLPAGLEAQTHHVIIRVIDNETKKTVPGALVVMQLKKGQAIERFSDNTDNGGTVYKDLFFSGSLGLKVDAEGYKSSVREVAVSDRNDTIRLSFYLARISAQNRKTVKKVVIIDLLEKGTDAPVEDAQIRLKGSLYEYSGTTNSQGRSIITVTQGDVFDVLITRKGFESVNDKLQVKMSDVAQKEYSLSYMMVSTVKAKKFPLHVYVKDEKNKPVQEAVIAVFPGVSAVTDASGFAETEHKQLQGEYVTLLVTKPGYKDQSKRIMVGVGQGTAISRAPDVVRIVLTKGENERDIFKIVVTVQDEETDKAVVNAKVLIKLSDGIEQDGVTDKNGDATFTAESYAGVTARVIVTHKDYKEKWSDITSDLMTAKDNTERNFLVFLKKDCRTPNVIQTYKMELDKYPAGVLKIESQGGGVVTGKYGEEKNPKNSINGKFSDGKDCMVLEGTFTNADYKSTGGFKFIFSSDGSSFSGTWWHSDKSRSGSWSGRKR